MLNGNDSGNGKPLLTIGNLISIVVAAGMVAAAYAAVQAEISDNRRAVNDLWRMVFELKKDVKDWQAVEAAYVHEEFRRANDRINDLAMRLGAPPRTNGP